MPVPLQGRQPGCLHADLFAALYPIRALKPNQVSVSTACSAQRAARAKKTQGVGAKVPRVLWCGASLGGGGLQSWERAEAGNGC